MDGKGLKTWRQEQGLTQKRLALALGVTPMAVAYWEWGKRRIPALLHLALEALENRLRKEQEHGFNGRVPGVQKAE